MGDLGSVPGLGRFPGEGKGYPLQYSGLEISMDYIDVAKSWTQLNGFHFYFLSWCVCVCVCVCVRAHNKIKIQGSFVHLDKEVNICCCFLVAKSCLTFCDPMDCSLPGSSVHGIILARILEWLAISFSRGSSWLRNWTHISCTASRFFTTEPPGKHLIYTQYIPNWPGGLTFWC